MLNQRQQIDAANLTTMKAPLNDHPRRIHHQLDVCEVRPLMRSYTLKYSVEAVITIASKLKMVKEKGLSTLGEIGSRKSPLTLLTQICVFKHRMHIECTLWASVCLLKVTGGFYCASQRIQYRYIEHQDSVILRQEYNYQAGILCWLTVTVNLAMV